MMIYSNQYLFNCSDGSEGCLSYDQWREIHNNKPATFGGRHNAISCKFGAGFSLLVCFSRYYTLG